jgi:hypothetical protein
MIRVKQGRDALANPHLTRQGGVMGFILTYLTPRIILNRAEARHLIVNKRREVFKMTRADLFREYARVIEMCDDGGLVANDILKCVRVYGAAYLDYKADYPFVSDLASDLVEFEAECFTFALYIVENKPVFAGDYLYTPCGTRFRFGEIFRNENGIFLCEKGYSIHMRGISTSRPSLTPPLQKTSNLKILFNGEVVVDQEISVGITYSAPDNCPLYYMMRIRE